MKARKRIQKLAPVAAVTFVRRIIFSALVFASLAVWQSRADDDLLGIDNVIERGNRLNPKVLLGELKTGVAASDARCQVTFFRLTQRLIREKSLPEAEADQMRRDAVKYLIIAANQKYPTAQNLLGSFMLQNGFWTIPANPKAGLSLVFEAANQGSPDAMSRLSSLYDKGDASAGLQPNGGESLKWEILAERSGFRMRNTENTVSDCSLKVFLLCAKGMTPEEVSEVCKLADGFKAKQIYSGELDWPRRRVVDNERLLTLAKKVQRERGQ